MPAIIKRTGIKESDSRYEVGLFVLPLIGSGPDGAGRNTTVKFFLNFFKKPRYFCCIIVLFVVL